MNTVGFIGLGTMGGPMARNLARRGIALRVYDVDAARMTQPASLGATKTQSPSECAEGADMVITMLPDGNVVQSVLFGENGAACQMRSGCIHVGMSTVKPSQADGIFEQLKRINVFSVDAPVARSSKHAEEGKLMIMVGADETLYKRVHSILEFMGDTIVHCGPPGSGIRVKVINNYMTLVLNVLTAETIALGEKAGIDAELIIKVLGGTAAGKGHLTSTYPQKVLSGDTSPGFKIDLADKDLGIALDWAATTDVPLTTGAVARQLYTIAQAQGLGSEDLSAVLKTVRLLAGLR